MEAAFHSDALDDLAGVHPNSHLDDCDCNRPEFVAHNGANDCPPYCVNCLGNKPKLQPPLVDMPQHLAGRYEQVRLSSCMLGFESEGSLDFGFLLACDDIAPELFGSLVAWRTGTCYQNSAYSHVPGARNALRRSLHQTGEL